MVRPLAFKQVTVQGPVMKLDQLFRRQIRDWLKAYAARTVCVADVGGG